MVHRSAAPGLRAVLRGTVSLLSDSRKSLAVGIFCFAMLCALVSATVNRQIRSIEDRILESASLSWEELRFEVNESLGAFDQKDAEVVMARFGIGSSTVTVEELSGSKETVALAFVVAAGPWILVSFFSMLILHFIASVFFLRMSAHPLLPLDRLFLELPLFTFKMLVVLLWYVVRSFLWFPIIGPLLAVYMTPRLALAPALLAKKKSGIFLSCRESMKATKGRWFFMTGSLLFLFLASVAMLWFGIVIVAVVSLFSAKLSFFLWLLLTMFLTAVQMFFLMALSKEMA
ncbi:hypothetical protein EXS65_01480 [Candidatus Peribacteria bacterium]|nr:hypothetical protein [Candidatus Peribacteria bacterium]